jgi:pimeloyl-ACP methyl ester carboxylesterase
VAAGPVVHATRALGLFPHDVAREVIDADLRWRDPAAHRQVHLRVRRHVVTRIWGSEGRERERALADLMFLQGAVLLGTGALPGCRWHALARLWRTPHAGELFMATANRRGFRLALRRGNPRGLPRAFVDRMYDDFDRTTRRAVLELYRSIPDVARAGEELARALRPLNRPVLVLWGRSDPYIPVVNAERQRAAFPRAEIRVLERSGHWPFVDDPATVTAAVTGFLARHAGAPSRRDPDGLVWPGAALEVPSMGSGLVEAHGRSL